jgi:hypothetical protein
MGALAVGLFVVAGCSNSETAKDAFGPTKGVADAPAIPADAALSDFCYAVNGIRFLDNGTGADVIQERVNALAHTGSAPEAPPGTSEAIAALQRAVDELGAEVTVSDLDPVEAPGAPSPFDDPESGLVEWAEENCDGVYTEDFSAEGQGPNEDVIDNLVWLRNQYISNGECDRLAELYTRDSAVDFAVAECASGSATTYDLVGGGVTGPDSADVLLAQPDGTQFASTARYQGGTWKLTVY